MGSIRFDHIREEDLPDGVGQVEAGTSLTRDALRRLRRNRLAMISAGFLLVVFLACFVLVWFLGIDANAMKLEDKFQGPSGAHWLGTDHQGRDLLARLLYGGQISLLVGLVATVVSLIIGIIYGAASGYASARQDAFMMRIVDVLYAIPFLVIVIILQMLLGEGFHNFGHWLGSKFEGAQDLINRVLSLLPLIFAIGMLGWLTIARITRAQVLALKNQEFVEAARTLGLSRSRILFRHIIPNTFGVAVIYATLTVPSFILYEASLSYLGMGVPAPHASWGILIKEGANYLESYPRLLLVPSLVFAATLFSLNFLGDGIRDALDPKAAKD